jgi:hypothetical protein
MSSRPDLRIDWCSHEAAAYAVTHWHYSKSLPVPPLVKVGVWEDAQFIGCVIFSRGANRNLLAPYGLEQTEGCELVRVALAKHRTPVTRIVAIAMKFLKARSPGLRLIVSFADPEEGHHGGIYQGGNWLYVGQSGNSVEYIDPHGRKWHPRMVSKNGVKKVFGQYRRVVRQDQCKAVERAGKHRYLMPLDDVMRAQIQHLARPYPKRAKQAMAEYHSAQRQGGSDPHAPISDQTEDQRALESV